MMKTPPCLSLAFLFTWLAANAFAQQAPAETLPAFAPGTAPQSFDELWQGIDPRAEPLEVEVLKEWQEGDVVLQVLRYRVGVFKGQVARVAAVYARPKDGSKLPGLVQIHGGGQYADSKTASANAKRGYACISIAWAGRISAPGYTVSPAEVQLFWDGATNKPNYKVTTDWGAVDGYHAPSRFKGTVFPALQGAAESTVDDVLSPRNNPWFLCALAARRALTFLERQPQIDAGKLGVYGHSMGGKLTVLTAGSDPRVKAAAPSCGGMSDRSNKDPLFRKTVGDDPYLKRITCPIFFLSPANDFHGRIEDLQTAVGEIGSADWRVNCSPHHNHQDTAPYEVATQLWFDRYLKGEGGDLPRTPATAFEIGADGVPRLTVRPDASNKIESVDVFYTRHGQIDGLKNDMVNTKNRHWHHAPAREAGGQKWLADMPLHGTDLPLWAYANVRYTLDESVTATGYYHGSYTATNFVLSSLMTMKTPAELDTSGAKSTVSRPAGRPLVIENFDDDWMAEWFTYRPKNWPVSTHKIYDALYAAPVAADGEKPVELVLELHCAEANTVVLKLDGFAASASVDGGDEWQTLRFGLDAFKDWDGRAMASWAGKELRLGHLESLRGARGTKPKAVGSTWKGAAPSFRKLAWE